MSTLYQFTKKEPLPPNAVQGKIIITQACAATTSKSKLLFIKTLSEPFTAYKCDRSFFSFVN